MAAPRVGKGIVGNVGNVGAGKSGISHFSQKGEKKCSFQIILYYPKILYLFSQFLHQKYLFLFHIVHLLSRHHKHVNFLQAVFVLKWLNIRRCS